MCTKVACHSSVSLWKQKSTYNCVSLAQLQLFPEEHCSRRVIFFNKVTHSEENGRAGSQVTALVTSPLAFTSTELLVPTLQRLFVSSG